MSGASFILAILDADTTTALQPMPQTNGKSVNDLTVGKNAHRRIANGVKNARVHMNALRKDANMTKIPDDVVERALTAFNLADVKDDADAMLYAGEVFVAWERDRFSAAVSEYASEHGRQECCGHGVNCGDHQECCGQPIITIDFEAAISSARGI